MVEIVFGREFPDHQLCHRSVGSSDHGNTFICQLVVAPEGLSKDPSKWNAKYLAQLLDGEGKARMAALEKKIKPRWPIKEQESEIPETKIFSHLLRGEVTVKLSRGFKRSEVSFYYYSLDDIKDWASFIVRRAPERDEGNDLQASHICGLIRPGIYSDHCPKGGTGSCRIPDCVISL